MQRSITKQLSRLSLHDSTLESYSRQGNDVELTFDWANLTDLVEADVAEPLILGRTVLYLTGIETEGFIIFKDDAQLFVTAPNSEALANLELIVLNELDDLAKTISIEGITNEATGHEWVEWKATFTTCAVSWQSCITATEWRAGKSPLD